MEDEKKVIVPDEEVDEEDDDEDVVAEGTGGDAAGKKKKKKKNKKKKKAAAAPVGPGTKLPPFRGVTGYTDSYIQYGQTEPPTIPVAKLFAVGSFPKGEEQEHPGDFNTYRITSAEKRAAERVRLSTPSHVSLRDWTDRAHQENEAFYDRLRYASEVHRQVRKFAQGLIKPGIRLIDLCEALENKNRELVEEAGFAVRPPSFSSMNFFSMKFPYLASSCAGRIIDSAFTVAFDPQFDPLLAASKAATNEGVRQSGIDARLGEIGAAIQEVMESYEVTINGKVYPVQCIRNLNGHSIGPYQIHAGKSVPIVATPEQTKMEEGEIFAIETFNTTGRGYVVEDMECSHYAKAFDAPHVPLRLPRAKKLLSHIQRTFGTLPFCRRWLERDDGGSTFINPKGAKQEKYIMGLKNLVENGIVTAYPPLCDVKGSYTSQYEHTLILRCVPVILALFQGSSADDVGPLAKKFCRAATITRRSLVLHG
ncbi:hypothetical protein DYB32_005608, partial [Aphanomyces invadans]